ncbi:MAG: stage V sporulation protein AD [Clostridium sp.]|jgi:stage V sporulation protein AD|nr:stage V sporulation protein AD [Clostridium sp.]
MQKGKASIIFDESPCIYSAAAITGQKEGEGPLGSCFDQVETDPMFGQTSWEAAESELQRRTALLNIEKSGISKEKIRYLFGGDLLGQIVATSFGTAELGIPLFGLYGACSTMGEALELAAMTVAGGFADCTMAMASSHFASAERQFRFPLAYGNQRPFSTTWTVTGCGSVMVGKRGFSQEKKRFRPIAKITGITTGKIVDMKFRDSMNMGGAMAVAAVDTILQNFRDLDVNPGWYDKIITGDLGMVGQKILFDFLDQAGFDVRGVHMDCGMKIFDSVSQDTHSGGSGCGCAAVTFCSYILPKIQDGTWKRVLFLPTGALLSQISFNEGQSVPGIAHGVVIESEERR